MDKSMVKGLVVGGLSAVLLGAGASRFQHQVGHLPTVPKMLRRSPSGLSFPCLSNRRMAMPA